MKNNALIIIGSARKDSNTADFVQFLCEGRDCNCIDLNDYEIAPYSYEGEYPENDTFDVVVKLIQQHDSIVFATPVYWYAMSGVMKTFFDRLTDLVTTQKQEGRKLNGRQLILVATGSDAGLPEGFEVPFEKTAHYFDMQYKGALYHSEKDGSYKVNESDLFKNMTERPTDEQTKKVIINK